MRAPYGKLFTIDTFGVGIANHACLSVFGTMAALRARLAIANTCVTALVFATLHLYVHHVRRLVNSTESALTALDIKGSVD